MSRMLFYALGSRTQGSTRLPLKMKLRIRITRTVETTPADSLGCQEIWYTCPTEGGAMTLLRKFSRTCSRCRITSVE